MVRYAIDLKISKPRPEVWKRLVSYREYKQWMPQLNDVALKSGHEHKKGSELILIFQDRKKTNEWNEVRQIVIENVRLRSLITGKKVKHLVTYDLYDDEGSTFLKCETVVVIEGFRKYFESVLKSFFIKRTQLQLDKLKRSLEEPQSAPVETVTA